MDPILIDTDVLGAHLTVESYAFFMGLAAVVTVLVSWFVLARLDLPVRSGLGILALALVSIPIGARLLNVITKPQYYLESPDQVLTRELVGFSLMGGLLLAGAVGVLACRRAGVDPWRLADALTPGLFVGLAVMRIGCFLAGCCFGVESTVPWAVQFPYGSPAFQRSQGGEADGTFGLFSVVTAPTVHPTELYELLACLAAAGLAGYLLHRRAAPGVGFLSATIVFSLARLGNHFLREPSATDELPYLAYPALYVALLLLATMLLRHRLASSPRTTASPAEGCARVDATTGDTAARR